jgi:hypothetical protein
MKDIVKRSNKKVAEFAKEAKDVLMVKIHKKIIWLKKKFQKSKKKKFNSGLEPKWNTR